MQKFLCLHKVFKYAKGTCPRPREDDSNKSKIVVWEEEDLITQTLILIEFKSPVHRTAKRLETGLDWTGCNWTAVASCLLFGIQLQLVATALCKQYIYGIKTPILQANFGPQWVLRGVKSIFFG